MWSPLGQGVLTGKYRPGQAPPGDSRAASESMSGFIGRLMQDDVLEAVERLRPVAEQAGLTMAQLALAWVLRLPNVASAIIGASRPEQVHENAAASGVTLSADVLEAIDAALGERRRPLATRAAPRPDSAGAAPTGVRPLRRLRRTSSARIRIFTVSPTSASP